MRSRAIVRVLQATLLACVLPLQALSNDYPSHPVTLYVAYPPGGSVDLVARLVAPKMSELLGQSIIVMNIGGAAGAIATEKVVTAPADGYTLQLGSGREISIARLINPNVPYDALHDFTYVSLGATAAMALVGGPTMKAQNTLADVLAAARARPGQLTYATSGVGSPQHLVGELIKMRSAIDMIHVPFPGGTGGILEVLGGHVDMSIITLSSALEYIRDGRLKAYGVSEAKRSLQAPEIPSFAETSSLSDVDIGIWYGLLGPAKLPPAIVDRLNRYFIAALKQPDVQAKLNEQGLSALGSSPVDFQAYVRTDTERYRKIVDAAKIHVE